MKEKLKDIFLILVVVLSLAPLRFVELGYSDYIGDEHKAFIQLEKDQTYWDFFMTRRKGPMQFLVSEIPHFFTHDFRNEAMQRAPFAIISLLSLAIFYLLIKKLTGSRFVGFVAALLLGLNGFIVGFGRIAQYQNLNLFFSFLSLYFYTAFLDTNINKKSRLINTCLGTIFFALSLFSHWDAIFYLPLVICFFIKYIFSSVQKEEKLDLIFKNILLGAILILPFIIPYLLTHSTEEANQVYFNRRIGFSFFDPNYYILLFRLYNPFIVLEFLAVTAIFSILYFKRSYPFIIWFIIDFLFFIFLFKKPGTHIYNFIIPIIVLSALGLGVFWNLHNFIFRQNTSIWRYLTGGLLRIQVGVIALVFIAGFYYQNWRIYIDHNPEYPWNQIVIHKGIYKNVSWNFTTPKYTIDQKLPLFGFPHNRFWNQVHTFVTEQNRVNGENFGYITNEDKTVSEWYMDVSYTSSRGFYAVGIRQPANFVNDFSFPQFPNRTMVKQFYLNGKDVTRIYRVIPAPVVKNSKLLK